MNLSLLGAAAILAVCAIDTVASAQSLPSNGETSETNQTAQSSPAVVAAPPAPPAAPAEPVAPAVTSCCKLVALTPVELEIVTPASSKTSRQGEQIAIRVAEPVSVDGHVVIPAGTTGFAEVIQVSHRAFGGKAGELTLGLPYLTLGGQRIGLKRLRFGPSSGADRAGQAIVATAVVGIAGMLITGGSVDIKSRTRANAVVTTDIVIPIQPDFSMKE